MKYSILMPYYKRALQLQSTLKSFAHFYHDRKDFEIILIIDNKNNEQDIDNLSTVLNVFKELNIKCIQGVREESFSPASNFNVGANAATGGFLILTNPEAMHSVNVLAGLDYEFEKSKDPYIICSCLSVQAKYLAVEKLGAVTGKWYQHSNYRNTGCHFCSAITREKYLEIGGFSEEFSAGVGFDDDDFRNKVRASGTPFIYRDDLVTLHLFHEQASTDMAKFHHNKNLYHTKWGAEAFSAGQLPLTV